MLRFDNCAGVGLGALGENPGLTLRRIDECVENGRGAVVATTVAQAHAMARVITAKCSVTSLDPRNIRVHVIAPGTSLSEAQGMTVSTEQE